MTTLLIADHDDGTLVDASILIGALILDQIVDVNAGIARARGLVGLDHDARRVDTFNQTVAPRDDRHA